MNFQVHVLKIYSHLDKIAQFGHYKHPLWTKMFFKPNWYLKTYLWCSLSWVQEKEKLWGDQVVTRRHIAWTTFAFVILINNEIGLELGCGELTMKSLSVNCTTLNQIIANLNYPQLKYMIDFKIIWTVAFWFQD